MAASSCECHILVIGHLKRMALTLCMQMSECRWVQVAVDALRGGPSRSCMPATHIESHV